MAGSLSEIDEKSHGIETVDQSKVVIPKTQKTVLDTSLLNNHSVLKGVYQG